MHSENDFFCGKLFRSLASRTCCRLHLAPTGPHSARHVRRIVRAHLGAWGLPYLAGAAELGVTELLSNVVKHVPDRRCTVVLLRGMDGVRIEVHDGEPALPCLRDTGEYDVGGRGLVLLSACVHAWDAERAKGGGKVVWFELKAEAG